MTIIQDIEPDIELIDVDSIPKVWEALNEEESYLVAILTDPSGLDLAEFAWYEPKTDDGCFRAWPFQWKWWRCIDHNQADQSGRSIGKSQSIVVRAFSFPFRLPGEEMVITAPELIFLEPIVSKIEDQLYRSRLGSEMIAKGRRSVTHRPFQMNFSNGSRILGRIPNKDGRGMKGLHPVCLEIDECFPAGTLVLTARGQVPIEQVVVGDLVLTHRGRWRPVTDTFERERPTVTVTGHGHPGFVVSEHQPFWARPYLRRGDKRRDGHQAHLYDDPRFVRAIDLAPASRARGNTTTRPGDHQWATPTTVPPLPIPTVHPDKNGWAPTQDEAFFRMVGMWLADGVVSRHQVIISDGLHEIQPVIDTVRSVGYAPTVYGVGPTAGNVTWTAKALGTWLVSEFGHLSHLKTVPTWALGMPVEMRRALLEGYVHGDGFADHDQRYAKGRWKAASTSKAVAFGMKLLAQTLGYSVCLYLNPATPPRLMPGGSMSPGRPWYQIVGNLPANHSRHFTDELNGMRFSRVRAVAQTGRVEHLYDLTVDEDHSFVADSIVCRNSQDFPEAGWTEVFETVITAHPNHEWRCHGVPRGTAGKYFDVTTKPSLGFTVHRYTAMHRPTWDDEERSEKIRKYGGREDPDYKRNILGEHGDATNMLFVLHKLMRCVDVDMSSDYNLNEFWGTYITDSELGHRAKQIGGDPGEFNDMVTALSDMLEFPPRHKQYKVTWAGMDVGYTADPSEILIFGEYHPDADELRADKKAGRATPGTGQSRLKLLTRVTLRRIDTPLQVEAIMQIIEFYNPRAFGMDKGGNGLPLFHMIQHKLRDATDPAERARYRRVAETVQGFNFGEKVVVEIDETIRIEREDEDATPDEILADAGMKRYVLEHSTDRLRTLVDEGRLLLPFEKGKSEDTDRPGVVEEFQGQTFSYSKAPMDMYGRRRRLFSEGKFHALDAARMFAMVHALAPLEVIKPKEPPPQDVLDLVGF